MVNGNVKDIKFWSDLISRCEVAGQYHIPEDLLEIGFKEMGEEGLKRLLKMALDTHCDPNRFQGGKAVALRNFRYQILKQIQELEQKQVVPAAQNPSLPSDVKAVGTIPIPELKLVEDGLSSQESKPSEDKETDPWGENPL